MVVGSEDFSLLFQRQFVGKTIYNEGKLVGIKVLKGAGASEGNPNAVDAISGGTITSKALDASIRMWFEAYLPYLKNLQVLAVTPMPLEGEVVETTEDVQNN